MVSTPYTKRPSRVGQALEVRKACLDSTDNVCVQALAVLYHRRRTPFLETQHQERALYM